MKAIDLNCDMGESPEAIADGTQEALMPYLSSVNIACGGHAGDEHTMAATIEQALRHGLAIGAHPGYADRGHFGRRELELSAQEIAGLVAGQIERLAKLAAERGARISHVKPHGALYNQAARDARIARAIADGVARWGQDAVLVGLAGSAMLDVFRDAGFRAAGEAFADRRYQAGGRLRSRNLPDALITDPDEAAAQALRIAQGGAAMTGGGAEVAVEAQTICIHGDTPGAASLAAAVAGALRKAGIQIRPL